MDITKALVEMKRAGRMQPMPPGAGQMRNPLEALTARGGLEAAAMTPVPIASDVAAGALALDDLRKGDYGSAALNAVGILPFIPALGGMTKAINRSPTAFERRHLTAQKNAALPVEQGGLGLPPDNTAMDRARAMGFDLERPLYHGSLHDIRNIDIERSNPSGHAGRGFYMTPDPKDASMNYANINGPDINSRVVDAVERAGEYKDRGQGFGHTARRLSEGTMSPRRTEAILQATGAGDNLGTVYPVYVRPGQEANLVEPKRSARLGAGEQYDKGLDQYVEGPDADRWGAILNEHYNAGVDPSSEVMDMMTEGGSLGDLWNTVKRSDHEVYDDMGEAVSPGGFASDVVRAAGGDTVTHPTNWRNPQLNIAGSHTIALRPELVRSRFAAFDPMNKHQTDMLGFANPQLLGGMALGGLGMLGYDRWKESQ